MSARCLVGPSTDIVMYEHILIILIEKGPKGIAVHKSCFSVGICDLKLILLILKKTWEVE